MSKKYFWLKLKDDFFDKKEIKRLRRMAGGDTYTVIYLKMLLLSLKTDGKLYFDNIGDDFVDELSLDIDEDADNLKMTLTYLQSKGLLEIVSDHEYQLNQLPYMVGSETESAQRVRRHRLLKENKNQKALQSNSDVTKSNTEIEIETELELDKEKDHSEKIKSIFPVFSPINDFIELNKRYWSVISETRKTGKISRIVVYNTMNKWTKYDPVVIEYALKSHINSHAGKKEEYTIGIMRNTTKKEAEQGLISVGKKTRKEVNLDEFDLDD